MHSVLFVAAIVLIAIGFSVYERLFPDPMFCREISDEEFLAAIPNADPGIALRVREIVSEQLDIPLNSLHPDDRFVEDLKAG